MPSSQREPPRLSVPLSPLEPPLANVMPQSEASPLAAEFKANCLALMDEVRDHGAEFVITKHNQPVARLVPVLDDIENVFLGRGAGMIAERGDIVAPTAPDWEEGADI